MKKLFLLALASLWCGQAVAANHVSTCYGCDIYGMYDAAARATTRGTVYVFDTSDSESRKFIVETEIISLKPYWAFTWGEEIAIETDVKSAFNKYVTTLNGLEENPNIPLPPDFPVRSVAGAMLDPGASTVRIVDFLRGMDEYKQLQVNLTTFFGSLLKRNVPLLNLSDFLKVTKVIIEFPDGSTADYELYFSLNAVNGTAALQLKYIGNARLEDGSPAPTTRYGFNGFAMDNGDMSLQEWILWANFNGIPVGGTSVGATSYMSCTVQGSTIHCTLVKKP